MRRLACILGALGLGLVALPSLAEAQQLRFSTTAPGSIVGTGNTLGLSKATGENGPGTRDSIGTFLSLTSSVDDLPADPGNPWPAGTTYDWTANGSSAVLTLPNESSVLYAELVWGGGTNYVDDVTADLDTPVTLSLGAMSIQVSPDPMTNLDIAQTAVAGFPANYYMQSANVTAFVSAMGGGTYSVEGVPATQNEAINSLNAAGWTLVVVVKDTQQPVRNLSVFVGGSFVDENSQQDYTVTGFCTPPAGPFEGHVVISAIEGDANLVGDQLLIAPTVADPFVNLSGPNNPSNNFFCSQLNDSSGQLDMSGTFGDQNHDAVGGLNVSGGRQGWDVTTIPLSSQDGQLVNGQTSAILRTITTGDSYVPTVAAFAIDVNAPDFTGQGSALMVDKTSAAVGDTLHVKIDLENAGLVTADGLKLKLALEPGLQLVSFASDGQPGDISGNNVDAAALAAGVDEGTLTSGQARDVTLVLSVAGPPQAVDYFLHPEWDYAFEVCSGGTNLDETFGQYATITYDANAVTSSSASSTAAASGSTGSGAGAGGAGGAGSDGGPKADDGCGCTVPGEDRTGAWPFAALAAAIVIARARDRRRSR